MAELIGYFLTLDAIFTWGLASLVYKFGLAKTEPKSNLLFRLSCVTLATLIFSLIFGNFTVISRLNSSEIASFLIACLISGLSVTIGDMMYFTSLTKIDASRAYPLIQLSLVFVYPMAFIFFGEQITLSIILGGTLILSSVFILSSKDKPDIRNDSNQYEKISEDLLVGVLLALGTAVLWAVAIVSFNQARIISEDVFIPNFVRTFFGAIFIAILGIFNRDYYSAFKKENRSKIKYYAYIGIAGSFSLGLADSLFYKAAEINGLVLTSTITANTPMVQQILSILILKEKFRKRFFIAVVLIILGNYIILFM